MLEVKQLCKNYGNKQAVKNLNLTVAPGEIFCLLGQNGAGKTTTINILLGLITPTSGEAFINNISVNNYKSVQNAIAYIPENVQLYGNFSALENLDFFSRLAGYTYNEEKLIQLLQQANLEEDTYKKKIKYLF